MAHMTLSAYTSKTRESTVNFTHSESHAGLARDRNTNLGALASETM
jgi:hypothetical protein